MRPDRLSAAQARRIALASSGLAAPRPTLPGRRHLTRLAERLGMIQLDSVNVLARAHLMPGFSRLGPYDVADFESAAWGRRRAWFEYWGHAACLIPLATWPLLQWRMGEVNRELARFAAERRDYVARVRREIRDRGALAAADLEQPGAARGKWWGWSDGKLAMEYLFWAGEVTVASRRGAFERVYDLPERVLPATVLSAPVPSRAEAQRALLRIAAEALGVATEGDLRAYWRLKPDAKPRIAELVEEGSLVAATVEGWTRPAYLSPTARRPRRVAGAALVSPFDPLLWERDRALRVLGVEYRIGLYTPKEKRTDGYYVLPFLHGDRIAARVDLKADRRGGALHVHAAHLEPGAEREETAHALAAELGAVARWLGLGSTRLARRGDLAAALHALVDR